MNAYERKSFEIKMSDDPGLPEGSFSGLAGVYNNLDSYGDIVVRGAFSESLSSERRVRLLWQHDWNKPLGVVEDIKEGSQGLEFAAKVTPTSYGKDAIILLKDRAVDQMSFGFIPKSWIWIDSAESLQTVLDGMDLSDEDKGQILLNAMSVVKDGGWVRLLTAVDLYEISPVTFPANDKAFIDEMKSEFKSNRPSPPEKKASSTSLDAILTKMSDQVNAGQLDGTKSSNILDKLTAAIG